MTQKTICFRLLFSVMLLAFAKSHDLRLDVIVPPTHKELLSWLLEGRADLAIGFLEPTARRKAMGIAFSTPYNYESQHLVVHKDNDLNSLQGLDSHTVSVRKSSAYWEPC